MLIKASGKTGKWEGGQWRDYTSWHGYICTEYFNHIDLHEMRFMFLRSGHS